MTTSLEAQVMHTGVIFCKMVFIPPKSNKELFFLHWPIYATLRYKYTKMKTKLKLLLVGEKLDPALCHQLEVSIW